MKTIILTRHAKSSWADYSLADIERPLNSRGKRDGPKMAKALKGFNIPIDKVILSPSKRTRETLKYFEKKFSIPSEKIEIIDNLYHGYEDNYLDALYEQQDEIHNIMMIGHNPGITNIANNCIGTFIDNIPTLGIVIIQSKVKSWIDFSFNTSEIKLFIKPKDY